MPSDPVPPSPDPRGVDPGANPTPCLRARDRWILAATLALILIGGASRIPPGVCFGDAGDLQTSAAVLGIAHPPGYVGFAAVGYLLSKLLPFLDPAIVVSLACMACMALGLVLLARTLIRLGLPATLAAFVALCPLADPSVWLNLTQPEVYAPSWFCLVVAFCAMLDYSATDRRRSLALAAIMAGFLVIQRPPALFVIVFGLVPAWLRIEWQRWRGGSRSTSSWMKRASGALLAGGAPIVLVVGLTALRDHPSNPSNYIAQFNEVTRELPVPAEGTEARASRVMWLIGARQYTGKLRIGPEIGPRFGWVRDHLGLDFPGGWLALFGVLGFAGIRLWSRAPTAVVLSGGVIAGNLLYLLLFHSRQQAADYMPGLFAALVLLGGAVATLRVGVGTRARRLGPGLLGMALVAAGVSFWMRPDARTYYYPEPTHDAEPYLQAFHFEELPPGAMLFAEWNHSRPLLYAKVVRHGRLDVKVVTTEMSAWTRLAASFVEARPVFFTQHVEVPEGWELRPWNGAWRVQVVSVPADSASQDTFRVEEEETGDLN